MIWIKTTSVARDFHLLIRVRILEDVMTMLKSLTIVAVLIAGGTSLAIAQTVSRRAVKARSLAAPAAVVGAILAGFTATPATAMDTTQPTATWTTPPTATGPIRPMAMGTPLTATGRHYWKSRFAEE